LLGGIHCAGHAAQTKTATEAAVHGDSIIPVLIAYEDHGPSDRQQGQRSHGCHRTPGTGIAQPSKSDEIGFNAGSL